jgi:hypothetical protein
MCEILGRETDTWEFVVISVIMMIICMITCDRGDNVLV